MLAEARSVAAGQDEASESKDLKSAAGKVQPAGRWLSLLLTMLGASVAASAVGLRAFLGAAHVVAGDSTEASPRSYYGLQLLGLVLFVFASPAAVGAAMGSLLFARKIQGTAIAHRMALDVVLLVVAVACAVTGYSALEGRELISCGFVWCYAAPPTKVDLTGFKAITGSGFFALALGMLVVAVGLLWMDVRQSAVAAPASPAALQRREAWKRRLSATGLLVALPLMLLLSGALPNTWERFSRNLAGGPTHSLKFFMAATGGVDGVMKSEKPGAWMVTVNWVWSENVVIKLFPDTVLFYGFLQGVVLVSALAAEFPRTLGRLLSWKLGRVPVSRWLLGSWFAVFLGLYVWYWAVDHLYHGDGKYDDYGLENPARTLGVVAVMLMGLLLLPASKSSPVLLAAGLSWESAVWTHIVLGSLFLAASCGHVALYFARFVEMGYPADILPFYSGFSYPQNPVGGPNPSNNFTVPLMSTVFWPSLVCFGVFPWLRRRSYELFKQSHYMAVVLVPTLLWHATHAWYFMLPGIVLWCADRVLRLLGACEPVRVRGMEALRAACGEQARPGRQASRPARELLTKVSFTWPGQSRVHSPGMLVLVNFPQLAMNEWHPFSLSSAPGDTSATLHVKNMGEGTFTGKLHELARGSPPCGSVVMNVQGPYGPKVALGDFSRVLLLAGGIGITPMLSMLRCALQQGRAGQHGGLRRLRLVWVVRSAAVADMLAEELSGGREGLPFELELSVFSTAAAPEEAAVPCRLGQVRQGRPDFESLLSEEAQGGQPLLVRACGPLPMVAACQEAADALGRGLVDFEPWSFEL